MSAPVSLLPADFRLAPFLAAILLPAVVVLVFWWIRHPWALDGGEGARDAWDRHSKWHIAGGAGVAAWAVFLRNGHLAAMIAVLVVAVLLELLQRRPRGGGRGKAEGWDVAWALAGGLGFVMLADVFGWL